MSEYRLLSIRWSCICLSVGKFPHVIEKQVIMLPTHTNLLTYSKFKQTFLTKVVLNNQTACWRIAQHSIQIMHIREVVSKNYSPRGNFIKVWNTRGWIILLTTDRLMCFICFIKWFQIYERSLVKTNARSRHSSITHRIYMTIL